MAETGVQILGDETGYYFQIEDGGWMTRRIVHIKKAEHGYSGFVPSMGGVSARGDTLDDVRAKLVQAINDRLNDGRS